MLDEPRPQVSAVRQSYNATLLRLLRFSVRNFAPGRTRALIAQRHLRGAGIEIGALHRPTAVAEGVVVRYLDYLDTPSLRRRYPEFGETPLADVSIVDDGESLATIRDDSQDFLIANHFLEHTQDPIRTIKRHLQVLRPGGVLFLTLPDKRWSCDRERANTTFAHLRRDHEEGPASSYDEHLADYAALVDKTAGPAFSARVEWLRKEAFPIHFHVWDFHSFAAFLTALQLELALSFTVEAHTLIPADAEFVSVLRKSGGA